MSRAIRAWRPHDKARQAIILDRLACFRPRFSGDSFTVSGTTLTRALSLSAGQAVTLKVQLGALADEIPESTADYNRFRGYDANAAFLTHLREYNQWWVDNVPYIDLPNKNIEKMVYYRMFLNRFNYFDGNIPGSDYQFPVTIEGVTGYNNAIQLTQPMHMQDLKYFRNPVYSYGNWLSSGENSKYGPFTDNPGGSTWGVGNPNGTYEQYIGLLAIQVADFAVQRFDAPGWTMPAVLIALPFGLALAVFLSWAFEVTSAGVVCEAVVDRTVRITDPSGWRADLILLVIVAIVIVFMDLERLFFSKRSEADAGTTHVVSEPAANPGKGAGKGT